MNVTKEEFYQALFGEADEEVCQRVSKAIEDNDPIVRGLIEERKQRALEWLRLIGDPAMGVRLLLKTQGEEQEEGKKTGGGDDA